MQPHLTRLVSFSAAASDRPAPGPSSPRPSARSAAADTDRAGPWSRSRSARRCRVTVCCGCGRLLVGLTATRQTIGSPLLMPPSMPPWRLVSVPMRAVALGNEGVVVLRCRGPWRRRSRRRTRTPVTAGSDSRALARSALSLSKTGSPRPGGTPVATSSQTPPIESWSLRTSSIRAIIRSAAGGIGAAHRRRLDLLERDLRRDRRCRR